jgi:lambda family phage portal protein
MSFFERFKFGGGKDTDQISADASPTTGVPVTRFQTRWLGASHVVRSLRSWFASIGSGTSDLEHGERRTLRARSRDAFRNHPVARAALTRPRTNIVGTGLMCRPAVDFVTLGLTADEAHDINKEIRTGWERWAEDPIECDAEATLDIYGQQSLVILSAMASGDCFALTPFEQRPGGLSGLKVQIIEADRIENPNNMANVAGQIDGVTLSPIGQPVGYTIRSNHPGDNIVTAGPPSWEYFPAFGAETGRRRVMHVWNDKERPGQVRGAPFLAPILEPLRQLAKWSENEMMAAVVSSLFTVFLKRPPSTALNADGSPISPFGNEQPTIPPGADPSTFVNPAPAQNVALGNGAIIDLNDGEEPVFANPARPNAQFDPFFVACVKQIGAALEIPSDELLLTYAGSYTAARAAMLQAWRFYLLRRGLLILQFCQPVYGLWMDEEVASGRLKLPGYADPIRRRAWSNATWIGPARGAMDELKEAQAAEKRIQIGVSNEAMECAAMSGESRDTVYDQQVREINQRKADETWELRPTGAVRFTPLVDPDSTPHMPSDPAQVDDNSDDSETPDTQAPPPAPPPVVPAPPVKKSPAKVTPK